MENLKLIDVRNHAELAVGGEPVHGLTPLADMSQQEYEEAMLDDRDILKVSAPLSSIAYASVVHGASNAS